MSYPDSLLYRVTRPARYTGGEWNAVVKDWEKTNIKFALAYPDLYEIGMSNMALPILYDLLNRQPDVLAERVFAPWADMAAQLLDNGIPLAALESGHPLRDFDVIGFSLSYELTYTNILTMLHLAGIPVKAAARDDTCPLIIGGGSGALNPEPMSDFIDLFIIGDGEEVTLELIDLIRRVRKQGGTTTKQELLLQAAAIPGIYVPSLYRVEYLPDGRIESFTPTTPGAPASVRQRIVSELPPPVTRPVVPFIEVTHDRAAVEIQRGCTRGCRFCQAGNIYRPRRKRTAEEIIEAVAELNASCGYDEVSLVSLCTSDYPDIDRLVPELSRLYPNLTISLPSLRLDRSSVSLVDSLPTRRKTGLTFAPEAGSQRLQNVINKPIPEEVILDTAAAAFERGWTNLKLYFMLGLPTETDEDIEAIVELVNKVRAVGAAAGGRQPQLRLSLSTFIPKPHTPFQWVAQAGEEEIKAKQEILKSGLKKKSVKLSWSDPRTSLLEAVLSRGDRRLGSAIYEAWQRGASFDAWNERFDFTIWLQAFEAAGIDPDFYARRERSLDEVLPWSHIETGVSTGFLKEEYRRALAGECTGDCRVDACNACGVQRRHEECRQKSA